ncbi:MAG: AmmeMemoRadiSam system protein B [Syntrophobacteraceae bacterium]
MSGRFSCFCRFFLFLTVFLLISAVCPGGSRAGQGASTLVHDPVVAGTWYPGTASELSKMVEDYLSRVPARDAKGPIAAIIAPHAGYIYSGQVAAYSFKVVQGQKFDTVIVIGPSHYVPFSGAAVYDCAGFRTPLGVIALDSELIAALMKREPRIKDLPDVFRQEHSLEAELPFLQVALPGFKLVPLVMGDSDIATCRWLAEAIVECTKGKSALIVASSDLSHYHSYDVAVEMDRQLLQKIGAMDTEGAAQCLENRKCEACGKGPIITAMLVAAKLGADRCDILDYANSGDVTGEKMSPRGVVGYGAACFSKPSAGRDRDEAEKKKAGIDLGLSKEERGELHSIARKAIEAKLTSGSPNSRAVPKDFPKLKEPRGAFVTIYKKGELRGCIGQIIPRMPLAEAVAAMAEEAAFRDPRFLPVRSDELGDLTIEISVLTPLQKIHSTDEIEVGKHGIVIARDGSMGLLLPQVATEYGWNRTEFLEHCCLKAGLAPNVWKDKETEIYIFSADVF